jgi:hypothetical protein
MPLHHAGEFQFQQDRCHSRGRRADLPDQLIYL